MGPALVFLSVDRLMKASTKEVGSWECYLSLNIKAHFLRPQHDQETVMVEGIKAAWAFAQGVAGWGGCDSVEGIPASQALDACVDV